MTYTPGVKGEESLLIAVEQKRQTMNFGGSVRLNPAGVCLLVLVVVVLIWFNSGGSITAKGGSGGDNISLKKLLSVSIDIAQRGGREVVRIREEADIGEKSKGNLNRDMQKVL